MTVNSRAITSGLLGASASCVAKLALDPDSPIPSSARRLCEDLGWATSGDDAFLSSKNVCFVASIVPRGVCLLLMVGLNALMMGAFLSGMNESGSVAATAMSTAANFSFSAAYGILLFDESVTPTWMAGFAMILCGVWMLSTVNLKTSDGV